MGEVWECECCPKKTFGPQKKRVKYIQKMRNEGRNRKKWKIDVAYFFFEILDLLLTLDVVVEILICIELLVRIGHNIPDQCYN